MPTPMGSTPLINKLGEISGWTLLNVLTNSGKPNGVESFYIKCGDGFLGLVHSRKAFYGAKNIERLPTLVWANSKYLDSHNLHGDIFFRMGTEIAKSVEETHIGKVRYKIEGHAWNDGVRDFYYSYCLYNLTDARKNGHTHLFATVGPTGPNQNFVVLDLKTIVHAC